MTLKHYGYMRSLLQTHASLNTGRISCGIRVQLTYPRLLSYL